MNKSSNLLRLDPFAIALEKKRAREEAEATPDQFALTLPTSSLGHTPDIPELELPTSKEKHTPDITDYTLPTLTNSTPDNTEQTLPTNTINTPDKSLTPLPKAPSPTPDTQGTNRRREKKTGVPNPPSGVNTPDKNTKSGVDTSETVNVGSTDRRAKYEARRAQEEAKVNFFLPMPKHLEIKAFAATLGFTLTELYTFAVDHLKECREYQIANKSGVNTPHDDLIIFKTHEDIIMLYRNYTSNRWKPHDDTAGKEQNGTDRRLLEIGILNTMLNFKGRRINSFKYFLPEIEELQMSKLGEETLDIMLKRRREQWEAKKRSD